GMRAHNRDGDRRATGLHTPRRRRRDDSDRRNRHACQSCAASHPEVATEGCLATKIASCKLLRWVRRSKWPVVRRAQAGRIAGHFFFGPAAALRLHAGQSHPSRVALRASSVRLAAPAFSRIRLTWNLIVFSLLCIFSAMSLLVSPSTI